MKKRCAQIVSLMAAAAMMMAMCASPISANQGSSDVAGATEGVQNENGVITEETLSDGTSATDNDTSAKTDTAGETVSGQTDADAGEAVTEQTDAGETITEQTDAGEAVTEQNSTGGTKYAPESTTMEAVQLSTDETITGSFAAAEGYDVATIRYYTDADHTTYAFADFTYDETSGTYTYSFEKPYSEFTAEQASEYVRGEQASSAATVVAEYFSTTKWDGAVDVSWYNETDTTFHISTPAQLAGLAAIVNGRVDSSCEDYMIKGDAENYIVSVVDETASLPAGVVGPANIGQAEHDFSNRTVILDADLDMGGTDGANIVQSGNNDSKNSYDYPNWTPIGGEFLMDVSNPNTMGESQFNGTFEGGGHHITNLYCYRFSYPHPEIEGYTAYAYNQGTGLFGCVGILYDDEENPTIAPTLRNFSVSGYVYGRRMVGGVVGCVGGGSNAVSGDSVSGGVCIENIANHCYVYNTDSKGVGGIVGCAMASGSLINCYNDGAITTVYADPAGGIIGSNEQMDIFCCYNVGKITTPTAAKFGRGIGGTTSSPHDFTVDSCYYLNGTGDDPTYPGFYTYNLPDSCSVNVTGMTKAQMQSATLLNALNVNGTAYVAGDNGYPVLYWEKNSGTGSLTVNQPEGGSVTADQTGTLDNGTIVYLGQSADVGYNFRYFTLNGGAMTGDYVTVNGDVQVSAYMESAKAGVIRIPDSALVTITVVKTGYVLQDGEMVAVENYPVKAGDEIYENDVITVKASLKDGVIPEDLNMDYRAAYGLTNAYDYSFTYTDQDPVTQINPNFTVGSEINTEGTTLTVEVTPRTTPKLWSNLGDTSWYDESQSTFTLTTAAQLAGLDKLVEEGNSFSGKTIKLGNDISLKNIDGTTGNRYWNGIGNSGTTGYFAGTFDGQGYKVTDLNGVERGLFAQCKGASTANPAIVKNVSVYGETAGAKACGIVADATYTTINSCDSYVVVNDGTGNVGGILSTDLKGTKVINCINYAVLNTENSTGGVAGLLTTTGSVTNCINYGEINVLTTTNNHVGGVVGDLSGSIESAANYGDITAGGRNIGGVAGFAHNSASLIDCYNVGDVTYENGTSTTDSLGGIIGYGMLFEMENCFDYGTVTQNGGSLNTNIGSVIGRDGRNSKNVMENIYVSDTANANGYVALKKTLSELKADSAVYYAGFNEADSATFADANGVLAGINDDQAFVLTNGTYPEISMVADAHVHSGGVATCTEQAVCEVCGLSYGPLDPDNHVETEVRDQVDPIWVSDGYTGDTYCTACGEKLAEGEVIPAEKDETALDVTVRQENVADTEKSYTREAFDQLKTTDSGIAYGYGADSTNMMVTTEYVTITSLLADLDLTADQVESITVVCDGSQSVIPMETLNACCHYYDPEGNVYDAPAAFGICYNSGAGTVAEVAAKVQVMNELRFGYGISQAQYEAQESLGGKRCVSPVRGLIIQLKPDGHLRGDANLDGVISAADMTCIQRHATGLELIIDTVALDNADVTGDGQITTEDANQVGRYLARLIDTL